MIGSIDRFADIEGYLELEEIKRLSKEKIEGSLIILEKPKKQGTISISVDNQKSRQNSSFGIGIDDTKYWKTEVDFHLGVFLNDEWYSLLRENKLIGTRHRMRDGSKITIYNRSRLRDMERLTPEHLEFYRDNRDKLRKELG